MNVKNPQKEIEAELTTLFKRVTRRNKSGNFLLVDLHIHTPASKCYKKTSNNIDECYTLLLKKFASSDVSIFAITDHNTSEGYFQIKNFLKSDTELSSLLSEKLILPGVEITCYSKHFLVLFPEDTKKELINTFLLECGIALEEQGQKYASADKVSPLLLCEKVEQYGGITILAHCDAEHGLLQSYIKQATDTNTLAKKEIDSDDMGGNSIKKILQSPSLHGICYNSCNNLDRIKKIVQELGGEKLALLQASDSHSHLDSYTGSGLPVGSRCSWVKLGQKSFHALRLALRNSNFSIVNEMPEKKGNPYVIGLCIRGGFVKDKDSSLEWASIPYSSELNCIVGARGTGKSTIMSILKFLLDKDNIELKREVLERIDAFNAAVVFLQNENQTFAIRMEPESLSNLKVTYYKLKDDNSFTKIRTSRGMNNGLKSLTKEMDVSKYLTQTNIQSYAQKELFSLANNEDGPSHIIDTLCALQFKDEFKKNLQEIIKYRKEIPEECIKIIRSRQKIDDWKLSSKFLEEAFEAYKKANVNLQILKSKTIKHLNDLMKGKLNLKFYPYLLSPKESGYVFDKWIWAERTKTNITYEKQLEYKRRLNILFSRIDFDATVPYYIFTGKAQEISNNFRVSLDFAQDIVNRFRDKISPEEVLLVPKLAAEFDLNVNYGISNKELYKPRKHLSIGQRAVGILFLILHGATELGENRPLFIDQPEDDLDNSYIYHILVKEFQRIKNKRQLIIATHNPNIPIAGDAENILVLASDGENGWVDFSGSIEDKNISANVLRILEGDFEAFSRRAEKYGFSLKFTK
ncbi:AAA family ATPase [Anaerospora hongkongensis]|uniref:AAA family ATPase n=1 Tax=Anaerospora hongkongensis TaxID=244830 RepID=UPI002FDABCC5